MYFPNADVTINLAWLLPLGLTVGVLSGFFGVGGGFLVTGGLIVFGVPVPYAVGTGLALIMATSIVNTLKHRKLGNVDIKLGLYMVIGTIPGVEAAKRLLLYLESVGIEGPVLRYVYFLVLAALGSFLIYEYLQSRRASAAKGDDISTGALVERVRAFGVPPLTTLPVAGISRVSIWVLVGIGVGIGFFAGLLGAGGGFLLMPILIFVLGVPTSAAVGTDLFQIVITGSYGTLTYALSNRVDLLMALVMLAAASVGSQLGTLATTVVDGARIRFLYAITILAGSASIALKQMSISADLDILSTLGAILLLGVAGAMCVVIALMVIAALARTRAAATLSLGPEQPS